MSGCRCTVVCLTSVPPSSARTPVLTHPRELSPVGRPAGIHHDVPLTITTALARSTMDTPLDSNRAVEEFVAPLAATTGRQPRRSGPGGKGVAHADVGSRRGTLSPRVRLLNFPKSGSPQVRRHPGLGLGRFLALGLTMTTD
jgi:hypothetical protein